MAGAMIAAGMVLIIVGTMVKPEGESVGWSPLWGFSANSTLAGKAIYVAGAFALIAGIYRILG